METAVTNICGSEENTRNNGIHLKGTIICGASSKVGFVLHYFLSNFLYFPKIFSTFLSNSPLPPSPASRLAQLMVPCSIVRCDNYIIMMIIIIGCGNFNEEKNRMENTRNNGIHLWDVIMHE